MKIKTIACAVIAAFQCLGASFAGDDGWTTDFEAARKKAAEEKKDLLLDFTGSDWCPGCINLHHRIFSSEVFKTGAKDKFVLVEVDFPQDQTKQDDALKKQNEDLKVRFGIRGFPSIVLCDSTGKAFAKTDYKEEAPKEFMTLLDELRTQKAKRDIALKSVGDAAGAEKAEMLVSALQLMNLDPFTLAHCYGDVIKEIKAADPQDKTGFVNAIEENVEAAKALGADEVLDSEGEVPPEDQ
jgi:thioredoxin-related protein